MCNAGAGYGMALLAAYSCGQITSLSEIANQSVSIKERFEPRKYNAELYAKKNINNIFEYMMQ